MRPRFYLRRRSHAVSGFNILPSELATHVRCCFVLYTLWKATPMEERAGEPGVLMCSTLQVTRFERVYGPTMEIAVVHFSTKRSTEFSCPVKGGMKLIKKVASGIELCDIPTRVVPRDDSSPLRPGMARST
ncbi:uncharacterized protein LOC144468668 isoform X2 [Augochlora pura]